MKSKTESFRKRFRPLYIFMLSGALVRILLSHYLGNIFMADQLFDDVLLFSYSAVRSHFMEPTVLSMAKTMVFPLFLDLVAVSGIPYDICLSGLYIFASLTLFLVLRKVFRKETPAIFGYFYFLFIPTAFDAWCGLRIYRNAIFPPMTLIFFSLLIYAVFIAWRPEKLNVVRSLLFELFLGIVFSVNYYIREDGIWLLVCLTVFQAAALSGILFRKDRETCLSAAVKKALLLALPLVVFFGATHFSKKVNEHFFGAYEIETRTSGEQGKFAENLYRMDSDGRSASVWTPTDVIDRAFEVSETLRSVPGLHDAILHCADADGDMYAHPITGDRIQWVLKEAMLQTGAFESEGVSEALFRRVNEELEAAYKDGRLKESDRIQLLPSSGGFTIDEILGLRREMWYGFKGCVMMTGGLPGLQTPNAAERQANASATDFAARVTNDERLLDIEKTALTEAELKVNQVLSVLCKIYGVISLCLFSLAVIAAVWGFVRLFRKEEKNLRRELLLWLGLCAFLGIGVVYLFGISWFTHFIWGDGPVNTVILNFYLAALPVLWLISDLFAMEFWLRVIREKFPEKPLH